MDPKNHHESLPRSKKRLALNIVLIILVMFAIYSAIFTIDETQWGVVTRFGRPLEKVRTSGFHLKFPWPIDEVVRVDKRLLVLDLSPQSLLTYDENNVMVNPFMIWQVTDAVQFVSSMQNRATAESRLSDIAIAALANTVGGYPFKAFINLESSDIEIHKILAKTEAQVSQLARSFGIEVNEVGIKSFLLPIQNRISVIQRMNAERARIAAVYRSQGIEEALTIEAQAVAEHERILGQAHAKATAIRGEGEAEALKILGDAYAQDPQFFRFIRSLESYEAIIGSQSTVFLESNSPLLKYFNGTEAQQLQKN
ncbi:MAG: protease modulator HflC [Chlamydiales bacterium]|nr:protease modulator HflC [Chlamydiales bacterium]